MATRKTYSIPGLNAVKLIFYLNGSNAKFHVEFNGGSTYNGIPASFSTTDPACQAAIERDERFRRTIFLTSVYNFNEENEQLPDSPKPTVDAGGEPVERTVVEEVTDINGVVEYLKANCGCTGNQLRSLTAIKRKVNENALSFPNVDVLKEEE